MILCGCNLSLPKAVRHAGQAVVLSLLLFKEPFYWTTVTGIVLVMAAVVLIALRTA